MKLRLRGDSIRLRLTRSEVRALEQTGAVEEKTRLAPGTELRYRLLACREARAIEAGFEDRTLTVRIPWEQAMAWSASSSVSLKATQGLEPGAELGLLIEKDFFCLKPREHVHEDESDMFPNPNAAHGRCGGERLQ
jgi:hypothetical protein